MVTHHPLIGHGDRVFKRWRSNFPPSDGDFDDRDSPLYCWSRPSFSVAFFRPRLRLRRSDQTSPTAAMRSVIVRSVKVRGPTAPPSISAQVHGAETGAPALARTA